MTIKVKYLACDGSKIARTFKTIAGARKFAELYVGKSPEMGSTYAISGDGIGRVTVEGATLKELFPGTMPAYVPVADRAKALGVTTAAEVFAIEAELASRDGEP